MKIRTVIPWSSSKNLADVYNEEIFAMEKGDWCVFLDRDAMFCHPFYGKHLEQVINENKGAGLITCVTNRINPKPQLADGANPVSNDMEYHHKAAERLWRNNGSKVQDVTTKGGLISGMMMAINVEAYLNGGGVTKKGMIGVDNEIHMLMRKQNKRVLVSKGIYVYHWYRNNNQLGTSHLK